ncbi:EamA family transporter [Paenibacillus herberti]|uniref:EamA family transporter n=1 Tax=Paenibacillus herberti TaxID=1619309 RepID=A0A229NTL7_9BACL|nr:EamA family transporter [Paenibacillus herberti]OXM13039.1 EamA family transporter [Paenibacillus herberti]
MLTETTWLLIAIGSALIFGFAGWWMKVSQMKGGDNNFLLLGLYITGTAGFLVQSLLDGGWSSLGSWRLWLFGAVIGAGSAWGNIVFMKALQHGPASLTSPITNLNIIFVIGLSVFLYREPLGLWEAAGVGLLLAAAVLIAIRPAEKLMLVSRMWFFYTGAAVLLFTFRNGGLKVTGELGFPASAVLFTGYLLSLFWFAGKVWVGRSQHDTSRTVSASKNIGLQLGLLAGLFSYGGLQLYALALETGKANLAAPIFATNSLVVAAGSILLYRERLTRLQWLAFVSLMAGLIMVRL